MRALGLNSLGDWPARVRQAGTEAAGKDAVTGRVQVEYNCAGLGAGWNLAWFEALGGVRTRGRQAWWDKGLGLSSEAAGTSLHMMARERVSTV